MQSQPDRFWTWIGIILVIAFMVGLATGCTSREDEAMDRFTHQPSEKPATAIDPTPEYQQWYSVRMTGQCGKSVETPGDMMDAINGRGYEAKYEIDGAVVTIWYRDAAADMRYTYLYYHSLDACQAALDARHYIPAELK